MRRICKLLFFCALLTIAFSGISYGANITFDDLIQGATSYSFDADLDGQADVVFSTTDPVGFNTTGPGAYMTYIQEPGLEGTTLLIPDLRVDFLTQARGYLKFGFALDSHSEGPNTYAHFRVFDAADNIIASDEQLGLYTYPNGTDPSDFPEGQIDVTFSGVAAYALFNFSSDSGRYIIDNFEGTYGTTEVAPVPEPTTMLLFGAGLLGLWGLRRKFKK
jgi:hypothetical protein